jgi:hypothetical protein
MIAPPIESESSPRPRPVGLHAIVGVFIMVAVIGLLLVVFYQPFPIVTVINATDHPLEHVELQTVGSETHAETHELGMLTAGKSLDVTVRSYEVTVLGLKFELEGEVVEFKNDPLPIKQGQGWRLTVERGGKVTGTYLP